jgi:hypothetical protein
MSTNRCNYKIFGITAGVAAVVSVVFSSGCYETYREDPVGTLTVPFEIAYNGSDCEAAGVVRVLAVLNDGEYETEVSCDQYEIIFEDLQEGEYSLSLYGLNAKGVPIVDSLAEGLTTVTVVAYSTTTPTAALVLSETPVQLLARWDLDWGSCESRNFPEFRTQVYDPAGNIIFDASISCNEVGSLEGEFRQIPDKKRHLVNPVIDRIEIQPTDKKGGGFGENYIVRFEDILVPGPGEAIELSFKCLQDGCYIPGAPCGVDLAE